MSEPGFAIEGATLPLVVPALWREVARTDDGRRWVQSMTGLSVILSVATEGDGRSWLHLSVAHPSRLPTWTELTDVKDWALGTDRYAAQVFPPRSLYVNIHPYCLHLFSPVDREAWPLPDFTSGSGSL